LQLNFLMNIKVMKTEERIEKQRLLIEEIGMHFDKEGFQPIAGRILGLLMVMDKEQYSFEEIVDELGISKSSASVALRNLEIRGNIEYFTIPGDRKRYFQMRTMDPFALIDDFTTKMSLFKAMQTRILELKADQNSRNAIFFRELSKMIEFVLGHMDALKEKYTEQ